QLADALAQAARQLAQALPHPGVVGVVANRVATARAVGRRLQAEADADTVLVLHSRFRPWDVQRRLQAWLPYVQAVPNRQPPDRTRFVVATQVVEVGLDWHFDALVTELAPLSALGQRLGRLNRTGALPDAQAIVVQRPLPARSLIYPKTALEHTLKVLRHWSQSSITHRQRQLKVAPLTWQSVVGQLDYSQRTSSDPEPANALTLAPGALRQLTLTSLPAAQDPDLARYLHGWNAHPDADIAIAWRDHLPLDPTSPPRSLLLAPPTGGECVSVPRSSVLRWLFGSPAGLLESLADISQPQGHTPDPAAPGMAGWVLIAEDPVPRPCRGPQDLPPHSVLVLPAARGGYIPEQGWDPDATRPVPDLGNATALADPSRPFRAVRLRLGSWQASLRLAAQEDALPTTDAEWAQWLAAHLPDLSAPARETEAQAVRDWLHAGPRRRQCVWSESEGVILRWSPPQIRPDTATVTGSAPLASHQAAVAQCLERWAYQLGLPESLALALREAGAHHDDGKRDPRFQGLLQQQLDPDPDHPLAKRWPHLDPA
ncbi:MAG: hypothetical protein OWV35_04655, partial [Firmicutes bacterium]|nr:hypothetical protein [Bacillota bacterium]